MFKKICCIVLIVKCRVDCFVVPPRNDVIAKPTKEDEAILVRKNKFNITVVCC